MPVTGGVVERAGAAGHRVHHLGGVVDVAEPDQVAQLVEQHAADRLGAARAGERIALVPDVPRAHVFDAESGVRIAA